MYCWWWPRWWPGRATRSRPAPSPPARSRRCWPSCTHVLSASARAALMPWLVSVDQMPRTFSETWQWLQRLGTQALGAENHETGAEHRGRTANMLADTRYIAAVAVPEHAPIFRWQEQIGDADASREACQQQWAAQAQPTLAALLPGCGFESLLPDAYYVSNREADRRVRPLPLRAAISWLEGAVNLEASQLRAVVAGCGESGSTNTASSASPRATATTYYGCVRAAVRARETCRPTKASRTWSTKSPRCSRNTASTTCAAFPAAAARLLRGLRRAPTPRIRWANWCTPSCRRRRGRAGQVPLRARCGPTSSAGSSTTTATSACWRLARRLAQVPGWRPRLWVDDLRPSPASSPAGPGTGAPAMPGHRHRPLDAGAARRPDARRRGDRGPRLRSARRLPDAMRQVHPVWINLEYLSAEV